MRNLLALLSAAVLTFVGVGWYLGWYRVQNGPAPAGHHAVNIDIDKEKIGEDLHKGEEKLQEVLDKSHKEDGHKPAEKPKKEASIKPSDKAKTPANTPNLKQ